MEICEQREIYANFNVDMPSEIFNKMPSGIPHRWDYNSESHLNNLKIENKPLQYSVALELVDNQYKFSVIVYKEVDQKISIETQCFESPSSFLSQGSITDANISTQSCQSSLTIINHSTQCAQGSLTDANISTQFDAYADATIECKSKENQFGAETRDVGCQLVVEFADNFGQTEMLDIVDSAVQATVIYLDVEIQSLCFTEESICQTTLSMLKEIEKSTQTLVELANCASQAQVTMVETTTDMDFTMQDISTQFEVNTCEEGVQNTPDVHIRECQTSVSMSLESDASVQAVDSIISSQTESQTECSMFNVQEFKSQTGCSTFNLLECHSQTDSSIFNLTENESQTFVECFDQLQQTESNCLDAENLTDCNINSQISIESQCEDTNSETLINPVDESSTSIGQVPILLMTELLNSNDIHSSCISDFQNSIEPILCDGISQTDPVTIIIGDASFLINKLKSAAMDSSKVVTTGNEIQIELVEEKSTTPQNFYNPPVTHEGVPIIKTKLHAGRTSKQNVPIVVFQPKPPTISIGVYNCPFCAASFSESPALYNHLNDLHQQDQKINHHKPKGRGGKTTLIPQDDEASAVSTSPAPTTPKRRKLSSN